MTHHFTIVTTQKAALNLVTGDSHQTNVTAMMFLLRGNIFGNVQNPEKVNFSFQKPVTNLVPCSWHLPNTQQSIFFSHWLYILWVGLDLRNELPNTSLLTVYQFPQFLNPTLATSSSNLLHHLNFCLPLLLSPFPPSLVQRSFFADYFLNTFQVPTSKSFSWVVICLPSRSPCLCPINCLALSLLRFCI